jgi:hypothetical protein
VRTSGRGRQQSTLSKRVKVSDPKVALRHFVWIETSVEIPALHRQACPANFLSLGAILLVEMNIRMSQPSGAHLDPVITNDSCYSHINA